MHLVVARYSGTSFTDSYSSLPSAFLTASVKRYAIPKGLVPAVSILLEFALSISTQQIAFYASPYRFGSTLHVKFSPS